MSGVTDTLLAIAAAAGAWPRGGGADPRRGSCASGICAAARALAPNRRAASLGAASHAQFDQLDGARAGAAVLREVSPRTLDVVAATGELLSSRIVAAALDGAGVRSRLGRRAARDRHQRRPHARRAARRRDERGAARVGARRPSMPDASRCSAASSARHRDGHTTTLGRGGSDYSGALVGAGIGAREIQIWTDVDGMLTADPRVIAAPRLVPQLSFAEAAELAYFGAKVLHPSTILPAVERNIPVRILNSRKPDGPGTMITAEPPPDGTPLTALACKRDVTVVDITSSRMLMAYGFLRRCSRCSSASARRSTS